MGIMRRRMRRRMVVGAGAAAVAYHQGKKHGRQDGADEQYEDDQYQDQQQQATQYAPAPPASSGPTATDLAQIEQLAKLHESGALTDGEFSAAKAKLLA